MNTIMLASIIAGVILLLFIITAGTYYKLFSNNYTNILCGSYLFKDDFNSYISNTKLPLSKTGNKYSYTMWQFRMIMPIRSSISGHIRKISY